jgi:hypothetical protein
LLSTKKAHHVYSDLIIFLCKSLDIEHVNMLFKSDVYP